MWQHAWENTSFLLGCLIIGICCAENILGNTHVLTGCKPGQPAVGDPAWGSHLQPQLFYNENNNIMLCFSCFDILENVAGCYLKLWSICWLVGKRNFRVCILNASLHKVHNSNTVLWCDHFNLFSFVFTYWVSFISRTLFYHSRVYVHLALSHGAVTTKSHCILEFTALQNGRVYTSFGFGSFSQNFSMVKIFLWSCENIFIILPVHKESYCCHWRNCYMNFLEALKRLVG